MADLAASNVTYTKQSERIGEGGLRESVFKLAFGDGALTYPSGGLPVTKAKLGCPNHIKSLVIFDAGAANGLVYKYDFANSKIRMYEVDTTGDTDKSLVELDAGSDAPAAATLYVEVKGW